MLRGAVVCAVLTLCGLPGFAEEAAPAQSPAELSPAELLYELMDMPDLLAVMRQEGVELGADMAEQYFPDRRADGFDAMVARLYDTDRMDKVMRKAFVSGMQAEATPQQLDTLVTFFRDGPGQRIVPAELAARRSFLDDDVEDAARARVAALRQDRPELAAQVDAYVQANDLIEMNVGGALTANYNFYLGLVDGGDFTMSDSEIIGDVWGQEEATRRDSRDWLYAYLFQAYDALDPGDLAAYVALSKTAAGGDLNRVIFDAFGALYNQIYHTLGLSVATLLSGEEL